MLAKLLAKKITYNKEKASNFLSSQLEYVRGEMGATFRTKKKIWNDFLGESLTKNVTFNDEILTFIKGDKT